MLQQDPPAESPDTVERVWTGASITGRLRSRGDKNAYQELRDAGWREIKREPIPGTLLGPDRKWTFTFEHLEPLERKRKDRSDTMVGLVAIAIVVVGLVVLFGVPGDEDQSPSSTMSPGASPASEVEATGSESPGAEALDSCAQAIADGGASQDCDNAIDYLDTHCEDGSAATPGRPCEPGTFP